MYYFQHSFKKKGKKDQNAIKIGTQVHAELLEIAKSDGTLKKDYYHPYTLKIIEKLKSYEIDLIDGDVVSETENLWFSFKTKIDLIGKVNGNEKKVFFKTKYNL